MERAVLDELLANGLRDLRKDEVVNGERIRVKAVGDLGLVSQAAREEAMALEAETAQYNGGSLHLGICYSGEWERQMIALGTGAPSLIAGVPPINLVIRTGGGSAASSRSRQPTPSSTSPTCSGPSSTGRSLRRPSSGTKLKKRTSGPKGG